MNTFVAGQRKTKRSSCSSSSGSSRYTITYLRNVMEKLKSNQNRDSTKANYHGIWRSFNQFLIRIEGGIKNISWEERTVLFGSYLVEQGIQSSTIASYFSAIKHVLKTDGYEWDSSKAQLTMVTRSCKLLNDRVKIRLPIQRRLLELLLFELERFYSKQPYLEKLYKTALVLSYYGMMRVGELTKSQHNVKAKDIHIGENKDKILIILHSSKTHGKESKPQRIKLAAIHHDKVQKKFFCPFKIVTKYASARGSYSEDSEPFLIFKDKQPIAAWQFRKLLKELIKKLGLDPNLYNTHSLRAGKANDMRDFGFSLEQIRRAARWKGNGTIYKYLKN